MKTPNFVLQGFSPNYFFFWQLVTSPISSPTTKGTFVLHSGILLFDRVFISGMLLILEHLNFLILKSLAGNSRSLAETSLLPGVMSFDCSPDGFPSSSFGQNNRNAFYYIGWTYFLLQHNKRLSQERSQHEWNLIRHSLLPDERTPCVSEKGGDTFGVASRVHQEI